MALARGGGGGGVSRPPEADAQAASRRTSARRAVYEICAEHTFDDETGRGHSLLTEYLMHLLRGTYGTSD